MAFTKMQFLHILPTTVDQITQETALQGRLTEAEQTMHPDRVNFLVTRKHAIKGRLDTKGLTLKYIDDRYGLPAGTARDALRNPNSKGEAAIAHALGVHPKTLWSERYDARTGKRLAPQPRSNNERAPAVRQRRNTHVHSTQEA